ncbi:hypothetical protein OAS39_06105 [Pirellulales bacterium]|nr:hypothetical protein [Pirellulales bacterium]
MIRLQHLFRLQTRARRRRLTTRLMQPRRIALSLVAAALGVMWLANAIMSVVYREATDVDSLRGYISLALSSYAIWHVLRVACFRPDHPLESPRYVREYLASLPLKPRDAVEFHLAGAFSSALMKSACVTLLLLPDLPLPLLGFVGILLALWAVDGLRVALEIFAWGLSRRGYICFRAAVGVTFAAACLTAAPTIRAATLASIGAVSESDPFGPLRVFFTHVQNAGVDQWNQRAWTWILEIVTAPVLTPAVAGWLGFAIGGAIVLTAVIFRLYRSAVESTAKRERREFLREHAAGRSVRVDNGAAPARHGALRLPRPRRLAGIGPLAWRQSLGARRKLGGLLTALSIPAALSLLPVCAPVSADGALLSVAAGLSFYTFLLLPSALRFDFRRDVERLVMIKKLPIPNWAIVAGQVFAPVAIASTFQTAVLLVAYFVRAASPGLLIAAVFLLTIMNVLIFLLENLIFLWYPHRLHQEGLEIFLRATLTFTAKGLLFLIALGAVVAWSVPARMTADALTVRIGMPISGYAVFFAGILVLLLAAATGLYAMLVRAIRNFDPFADVPA